MRALGGGPVTGLARELEDSEELSRPTAMEAGEAFGCLRPRLQELAA